FKWWWVAPAVLTLDPETAHPNLILSKDLTSVTERESPQAVPRSPKRFLQSVNVLARASFKSGQHYWEVWVGNKTKWELGVASDNVDRAAKVRLSPENGYWTIRLWNNSEYWAAATPWVRLEPQCLLKKVGVLLDCKAKKLTFYNDMVGTSVSFCLSAITILFILITDAGKRSLRFQTTYTTDISRHESITSPPGF
uniref:B30.2/SPRY domain-containing protein n=1 Tax=Pseudonaja textilis TaxID=8673 RepID=A0A670Z658_PSETE